MSHELKFDSTCYHITETGTNASEVKPFDLYRPFLRIVKNNGDDLDLILRLFFLAERNTTIDVSNLVKDSEQHYTLNLNIKFLEANQRQSDTEKNQLVKVEIDNKDNPLLKEFFNVDNTKFIKVNIVDSSNPRNVFGYMRTGNTGGGSHDDHPILG